MRSKLVNSLVARLAGEISGHNPVKFLKTLDIDTCVDNAIMILYLYTRGRDRNMPMAEIITAIGSNIRSSCGLKKDSSLAAKAGAFMLYSFEEQKLVKTYLDKAANKHATYVVEILDNNAMSRLFETVTQVTTEKLPSLTPYSPWTSWKHETGVSIVKTEDIGVLRSISPEKQPLLFELLNRSQLVGWRINNRVHQLQEWSFRNQAESFSDIWNTQLPEAKQSKIREANTILSMAERFKDKIFYHLYTLDFRSRKYCSTAYLHEQGTDQAKGLLLRQDKKAITEQGFFWLCISIANNWAGATTYPGGLKTDKLPLNDRVRWVLDNEEVLLSYAENPKVHVGWMKAEKPWQFIAAVLELHELRLWQKEHGEDDYSYESSIEVYIDGSTNGSQHLALLTRDHETAPYVNLVPQDAPGDLYSYVAEHIWDTINKEVAKLNPADIEKCNVLIDTLIDKRNQISQAQPRSELRTQLSNDTHAYRIANRELIQLSTFVFWSRVTDNKHRRKVVKRYYMALVKEGEFRGQPSRVNPEPSLH